MSGAILFCFGGQITWKADRQDCFSLSPCEAEIRATNMGSRLIVNTRNLISDLSSNGYPIKDAKSATPIYNDNDACIQWCYDIISKGDCHIEQWKNVTCEWVKDGSLTVSHISGKSNPTDIFTKEMHDGANFHHICNAFMCCSSDFLKVIYVALSETPSPLHVVQTAHYVPPAWPGLLEVVLSHSLFHMNAALSCLLNAG